MSQNSAQFWAPPVQEWHGFIGPIPAQGHEDNYWIGASLLSGDTETAGTVQPGGEKAQGDLRNVYKYPMEENEDKALDFTDRTRVTGHKLKHIKYLLWGRSNTIIPTRLDTVLNSPLWVTLLEQCWTRPQGWTRSQELPPTSATPWFCDSLTAHGTTAALIFCEGKEYTK